ncbi:MAG: response regulator [Nitrospirota bacterium]
MQEIQGVMELSPWEISMHDKPRVLIADDDKDVRDGLRYALSSYEMDVTLCENGIDALQAAMNGYYDYIITDFKMPGMHGLELVRRLRAVQPALVVIIGMSGLDMGLPFLEAGANDFIAKPFVPINVATMLDGGDILG